METDRRILTNFRTVREFKSGNLPEQVKLNVYSPFTARSGSHGGQPRSI